MYRQFGQEWGGLDWSEKAKQAMFASETHGEPVDKRTNGYYVGKQWLGVTVAMWKEDLAKGLLSRAELYADPRLPNWWLDKVLA